MMVGVASPYAVVPLVKMVIAKIDPTMGTPTSMFSVLYNPETYSMTRQIGIGKKMTKDSVTGQVAQHVKGQEIEMLSVDLFLDTFNASGEVLGLVGNEPFTNGPLFMSISL